MTWRTTAPSANGCERRSAKSSTSSSPPSGPARRWPRTARPGKGNTLLNYCGIRTDFIDYTVDRNPHKQGNYLPGTRIPILSPEQIDRTKPDYLFLLVWNLKDEVMRQMAHVGGWGGKFIVPLPEPQILSPLPLEKAA